MTDDRIVVHGYGVLDENWQFRATGRWDDGKPLILPSGDTIDRWEIITARFEVVPHWPGFDAHTTELVVGPFTITQLALLRIDGSPVDVRDLDEPFEVLDGYQLDYCHASIAVTPRRTRRWWSSVG